MPANSNRGHAQAHQKPARVPCAWNGHAAAAERIFHLVGIRRGSPDRTSGQVSAEGLGLGKTPSLF
jgi:hypothetical protein